ncbi:MAG TPA: SPFH domain-containing protein [Steroidobacteraceae bacterium]|nr:SPFH domain-containing protein [Steroidobacteraceae bacterium]
MANAIFSRSSTSGDGSRLPPGAFRIFPTILVAIVVLVALFSTAYTVETGNVAVKKTLGTVDLEEVGPGFHLRLPFLTQVQEFSAKENAFDLTDLTPKAADNLSLRELDVTVFYSAAASKIADLRVKYSATEERGPTGVYYPAYGVVWREARGAVYEVVAKVDSLQLHKQREQLQSDVQTLLQSRLDAKDPGAFSVQRVVVRALNTDPSIEQSIQLAVQNQKKLEAKRIEVEIAAKEAEIEVAKAQGIAKANQIINASLTAEYLQHEINLALAEFAKHDGQTVVIPANMQGFQLLLNQDRLRRIQTDGK